MVRRMLVLVAAIFAVALAAAPARADDISASARGVVRIVTIAVVGDEVVGFGHGSGFAVAPNRVVTNAHVVQLAKRYPDNVVVGVVPSEGDKSFQGQVIAIDEERDLALIQFTGVRLAPLTMFSGSVQDGEPLIALGYPGNVDLATARSATDFIKPMSPVRSQGNFSGGRQLQGTAVLLHTAGIARGNSGGPLLDRCGRVLGVNSAITNSEEGDSSFAFAVAGTELAAFLQAAKQPFASVNVACTSLEEQLAQERTAEEAARAAADETARRDAALSSAERADAIAQARENNERARENYMAVAALMLVFGALCIGGAGLLLSRGRRREAIGLAIGGGLLILGAAAVFLSRPDFDETKVVGVPKTAKGGEVAAAVVGQMQCTLVPERSRVILTPTQTVDLDLGADGCINGRTQYAETGSGHWQRILVPDQEQTVSVLDYDPATRTYTNTRYLLTAAEMRKARSIRATVPIKACSTDPQQRAALAAQQQSIRTALPQRYNEKLVYRCATGGAPATAPKAAAK
jgi:hypothetical protein